MLAPGISVFGLSYGLGGFGEKMPRMHLEELLVCLPVCQCFCLSVFLCLAFCPYAGI